MSFSIHSTTQSQINIGTGIVSNLNSASVNGNMQTKIASCYTPVDFKENLANGRSVMNKEPGLQPVTLTFGGNLKTDNPNIFYPDEDKVYLRLHPSESTSLDDQIVEVLHKPLYYSILF